MNTFEIQLGWTDVADRTLTSGEVVRRIQLGSSPTSTKKVHDFGTRAMTEIKHEYGGGSATLRVYEVGPWETGQKFRAWG